MNPDTFEPLTEPLKLPGIVYLYEVAENDSVGMPKVKMERPAEGEARRTYSKNERDYCMKRALKDKLQLHGSEGHHLRLAIVVKAQAIGTRDEETAQLFQNQDDYDYDVSYGKVVETRKYDYSPWSCDALRDKCGKFVTNYCASCSKIAGNVG